jgi:hypothetical protein
MAYFRIGGKEVHHDGRNVIYQGDIDKICKEHPEQYDNGECVRLVQVLTNVGHTSFWRPGPRVVDLSFLNPGTVIANFLDGRFPNRHGFHACLFESFGPRNQPSGRYAWINEIGQWRNRNPGPAVQKRGIYARGVGNKSIHACDNADEYFVVVV